MIALLLACIPGHDLEYTLIFEPDDPDADTGGGDEIDPEDTGPADLCLTSADELTGVWEGRAVGADDSFVTRWTFTEDEVEDAGKVLVIDFETTGGTLLWSSTGIYRAGCPLLWSSRQHTDPTDDTLYAWVADPSQWGPGWSIPWPVDGDPETSVYLKRSTTRGIRF